MFLVICNGLKMFFLFTQKNYHFCSYFCVFNLFLLKSHSNWVSFRPHKITLGYSLCLNRICEKIMEECIIYMPSYLLVFMGNWYQLCLPPSIKTHRCLGPLWIGQVDITCTHHILLHTFTYYRVVVHKPSDIASGHMEILLDAEKQFYLNSSIPSQQVTQYWSSPILRFFLLCHSSLAGVDLLFLEQGLTL